jgi:hypothetical protein
MIGVVSFHNFPVFSVGLIPGINVSTLVAGTWLLARYWSFDSVISLVITNLSVSN